MIEYRIIQAQEPFLLLNKSILCMSLSGSANQVSFQSNILKTNPFIVIFGVYPNLQNGKNTQYYRVLIGITVNFLDGFPQSYILQVSMVLKLQNNIQKMVELDVEKEHLIRIVSCAQTRTFAQEIDLLAQRGGDLHWLYAGLKTNQKKGITNSQESLEERRYRYGSNRKYQAPMSSFCELFKQALNDFILKILIAASIFSIVVQVSTADESERKTAWIEGFVVLMAVGICALVTAINNYSKERQFQKLNNVADERKRVTLRRDGVLMEIHQDEVLVGDVVNVNEGMEVPADAILLEANEITTDESAMTGETDPLHKNTFQFCLKKKYDVQASGDKNNSEKHQVPSPILLSGTKILTGEGRMMILVVGDQSCIGKIRALLSQDEQVMTPLQAKLEKVAKDIGKFGLYSAILILLILIVRFAIQKGIQKNWQTSKDLKQLVNYFILGITVIVVAIPEGLPLSVTLSLAVSVKQMLNDSNLVRKMEACETMGGANNICSDKTGTLTMNKMTLTQIWNGGIVDMDTHSQKINFSDLTKNEEWSQLFKIGTCVNSTANLLPEEKGSSTEIALLKYLQRSGISYSEYREKYPTLLKYPFSSSRKRMSVLLQKDQQYILFVKGASEMVLSCCSKWHDMHTNKIEIISQTTKNKMEEAIKKMAESSLRTLCLAYKKVSPNCDLETKDEKGIFNIQKSELVLITIFGVRDIPRKEVPGAIIKCHKAGIKVRMVTGDNIITARAIAKDVGIIKQGDDSIVMQGADFINLIGGVVCKKCRVAVCDCARDKKQAEAQGKDLRIDTIQNGQQFDKLKDKLFVLARSRPEDKYALVTGLKERGEVVAVTGDGTNDAPALKKADVGFAMGIAGTEVAREAAAIILLDDNFNSIVKAVLWGRNIYDSIRKFIQFQLTVNIVAVFITLIGASLLKQQILAPIQMLWINLIMDTLASLALATEPPTDQLLDRKPNDRNQHIISPTMMKHIIGQAVLQIIILTVIIFTGEHFIPEYLGSEDEISGTFGAHPSWKWHNGIIGGTVRSGRMIFINGQDDYRSIFDETSIDSRHFTFVFNTFVMLQIFNFINCRKIHEEFNILAGILNNKLFIIIIITIFALQILLVTFTGSAFHIYSNFGLAPKQWLISMAIGSSSIPLNFILKLFRLQEKVNRQAISDYEMERGEQPAGEDMQSAHTVIKIRNMSSFPEAKFHPMSPPAKDSPEVGFM